MTAWGKKCIVCGEEYSYCHFCWDDRFKPAFMNEFHDENCYKIFDTCSRFEMGLCTREEALEVLEKCDLSNMDHFRRDVKMSLNKIFNKPVRGIRTKVNVFG